jgi:nucleolar protein 12
MWDSLSDQHCFLQAFSELLPRKAAFISGKLHPERDVVNAYIVYTDKASAEKALEMNAQIFHEKHLRVDNAATPKNHDRKKSVFIGNLPFDAQEEELWEFFKECGDIENVRIVRDAKTNIGKGIAYVQFAVSISLIVVC